MVVPDTPRKIISPRQAAHRFDVPVGNIYRAAKRGTLPRAQGPDVPAGIWFEEAEFERWLARREQLQRRGVAEKIAP